MADYKVGYGKPPKHTQFKKGNSGNPQGRPKGSVNLAMALQKALSETVCIVLPSGKRRVVSKMEAVVKALVDRAIAADMHAFRVLAALTHVLQPESASSAKELEPADREILQTLLRQMTPSAQE